MPDVENKDQAESTLLEVVLRVESDFRGYLAPVPVTPFQAGVILCLHRQKDARVRNTAAGVGVVESTLSVAVRSLVRKR